MAPELTREDRRGLLGLARATLERELAGRAAAAEAPAAARVIRRGAFVTLECGDALRGCIGRIEPDEVLARLVPELALAAAREDPRFPPVGADELDALHIEISLLTPPQALGAVAPEAIVIGRDGLIVSRGGRRGLLLPQVAPEWGWDAITFLDHTCRKAGLAPGVWREPGTSVATFQADVFGE